MPDSILENWGMDMRDSVMSRGPYCLLVETEKRKLIHQLLKSSIESLVVTADLRYLQLDPINGKERRDKEGGHIKIILESLGRNPDQYDAWLKELGLDMDMVDSYYQQRRESNSYYRAGLVYES